MGDQAVTGVVVRHVKTGETSALSTDGVFMAIGHDPATALFGGQLETDEEGYLVVREPSTETNVHGVFAAGDVTDHTYRQAVTAAGPGMQGGDRRGAAPRRGPPHAVSRNADALVCVLGT